MEVAPHPQLRVRVHVVHAPVLFQPTFQLVGHLCQFLIAVTRQREALHARATSEAGAEAFLKSVHRGGNVARARGQIHQLPEQSVGLGFERGVFVQGDADAAGAELTQVGLKRFDPRPIRQDHGFELSGDLVDLVQRRALWRAEIHVDHLAAVHAPRIPELDVLAGSASNICAYADKQSRQDVPESMPMP